MKDLTEGSIARQLLVTATPIAAGIVFQTLYFLVDLYFVAQLGDATLAGVSSAGTLTLAVVGLTQILGAGTVTLVAHAAGRKDPSQINLVFSQSIMLAGLCMLVTICAGYALTDTYVRSLAADPAAAAAGVAYLHGYIPGLAIQFPLISLGAALRGLGVVKPTMATQMLSVVLNIVFAPVLIAGWGTGHPLGAAGAGLATTLSLFFILPLCGYFVRVEKLVVPDARLWRPNPGVIGRLLSIGVPAGGEFLLSFAILAVTYWTLRGFGPAAQAGFGIGARIVQVLSLPVLALSMATSPVAGQNFGAGRPGRVRETFRTSLALSCLIMLAAMLLCQWQPQLLVGVFTQDGGAVAVGTQYLRIVSWNFVATAAILTCSGLFQGLGNTWPTLLSSGVRLLTFLPPALWLRAQPHFELAQLWYLSVGAVALQAAASLTLLHGQLRRRLAALKEATAAQPAALQKGTI